MALEPFYHMGVRMLTGKTLQWTRRISFAATVLLLAMMGAAVLRNTSLDDDEGTFTKIFHQVSQGLNETGNVHLSPPDDWQPVGG